MPCFNPLAKLIACLSFLLCWQPVFAFNCDDANVLFDQGRFDALLIQYSKLSESQANGCILNLVGLSAFKANGDNEQQKVALGIELLKRSAASNYLPGSYNLFKYAYKYTDTDLGAILDGLAGLVLAGKGEENRKISVLSLELGNQIIDTCSEQVLPEVCRNRRVRSSDVNKFQTSNRETLAFVRADVNAKSKDVREGKKAIATFLSVVSLGITAAGVSGAVRVPGMSAPPPPPPAGLTATEMIKLGILK